MLARVLDKGGQTTLQNILRGNQLTRKVKAHRADKTAGPITVKASGRGLSRVTRLLPSKVLYNSLYFQNYAIRALNCRIIM